MKKLEVIILCTFLSISAFSQGIEFFRGDWKDALAQAKEEEKLLFVDCYTTWCGPCKKMSSTVFNQPEVGTFYNENFVNIKLNMEKENGQSFGLKYPVSAYPTMFFISGDGDVVHKIKGFRPPPTFLSEGETAVKKYDRSGDYAELYENGDRSYEMVSKYVEALNKVGKPSMKIANDYINSTPDISDKEMALFLYTASIESDSRIYEKMVLQKDIILAEVGSESWDQKVLEACRQTVNNAIEYEYYDLIEEASTKVKDQLGKKVAKRFECESCIAYHKSAGDYDAYLEYMEKFINKFSKDDVVGLKWSVQELVNNFREQSENKKLALKAAKRIVKIEDTPENHIQYARVLDLNNQQNKAVEVLEKEREKAEKEGKPTSLYDRLLKKIKTS